ncbi:cell cycle transcriptional regulator TrcR [Rickettsiales endosymbiont of Stachyamoeba lipophora]|uniref:cell cycle transcriptional regulator TrcR n=1 Tax=Rickettsiales endosymbiont of Stachyamoeba lipophora TaxID=2486578 RepID=UPI000F6512AD|nr:cell cycle transcriptional regulator TrcR [Rickettsiales endosymbiont of Stachyamoeba lipophora]AZL15505.1 DUF1013 domain-containing protein [Rickettsiales endosymbiont of Stachyamoeba lipophora]
MTLPLMPKATAIWLIDNTNLTFEQIANFCGLHVLEVQGIADDEVCKGIIGDNPVNRGQLTWEEIKRCEGNAKAKLELADHAKRHLEARRGKKAAKYVPVAKRQDKPDAILWLIKNYPELSDPQIVKLIGTTKTTIKAVKEKTHWNSANLKPRDPVLLGLCKQGELDGMAVIAKKAHDAASKKD